MKIVFLTRFDPKSINSWSGTMYHIYHKLKEKHNVEIIGTEILGQIESFSKNNFSIKSTKKNGLVVRNFEKLNRLLSERINRLNCDLAFFGDIFFVPSDINIPLVYLSDLSYEQIIIHYSVADENFETHTGFERLSLDNAFRIIYSSEWIKQKAIEFYAINPDKIDVVELGANIPTPKNYAIETNTDICRLVFIGKDWERKGGDKVLEIFILLQIDGFPCTLTVIGSCPANVSNIVNLTVYPSLDKSSPSDLDKLCSILSESHFLVLPTNFDAFGIVFCEASAYALPSITADVGGVSQAVKEGKNGYLLPANATARDYAEKIKAVFNDREGYLKLRKSSRLEYEMRLNWDVWGEKVNKILEGTVNQWRIENGEWGIGNGELRIGNGELVKMNDKYFSSSSGGSRGEASSSLISVVMTAYNAEEFIAEAIESILNQSFADFEFIIVNDGSTDNTRSIICSFDDKRIRLIDNEHDYIHSLNTGLKASKGKYLARMDADDIAHIDRFKIQYSLMEEFPEITVCSSWMRLFGEKVSPVTFQPNTSGLIKNPLIQLLNDIFIVNPASMIRNSFLKERHLLYENYEYAEDYKFWSEMAKLNAVFYIDSTPLIYRRIANSQITLKYRDIQLETTDRIKKEIALALCRKNSEKYPSIMSLFHSFYELSEQKMISKNSISRFFYLLFTENEDVNKLFQ